MNEDERLAKEHWNWLSKVLERVYIDAFIHGYKHAFQYLENKKYKEREK